MTEGRAMSETTKKKEPETPRMAVWVGFSDGVPHTWSDGRHRHVAVFPTRREARENYEDARPMWLVPR